MSELRELFESWGNTADPRYTQQQWLLSKWELFEGVEWPPAKRNLMLKTIAGGLQLRADETLVDLGCGGGWIASSLRAVTGKVVGLDFSQNMLGFAHRLDSQLPLVCGDISQLPLKKESVDAALAYYVFLNFSQDDFVEKCLLEVIRILKSGGRALIGQLPDHLGSVQYESAKADHLRYCQENYRLGKNNRDTFLTPLRLFAKNKLSQFLTSQKISHRFLPSFNPFYRAGQPEVVGWRFDLLLKK